MQAAPGAGLGGREKGWKVGPQGGALHIMTGREHWALDTAVGAEIL